jgi:hypothetical protein
MGIYWLNGLRKNATNMKRIEVNTPSGMVLVEVISINHRPIMIGDYVLRKEVYDNLGPDGKYDYKGFRTKALFDRMDNKVGRSYSSNYREVWAIGQKDEKILENCVSITFTDQKLNDYYGVNKK